MQAKLVDLLRTLKLAGVSEVLERELALAEKEGLAPAQVIERLVQEEFLYRQERSLLYRVKQGRMPWPWTLQSFPFDMQP
jgi:DNA replication protein DnaC